MKKCHSILALSGLSYLASFAKTSWRLASAEVLSCAHAYISNELAVLGIESGEWRLERCRVMKTSTGLWPKLEVRRQTPSATARLQNLWSASLEKGERVRISKILGVLITVSRISRSCGDAAFALQEPSTEQNPATRRYRALRRSNPLPLELSPGHSAAGELIEFLRFAFERTFTNGEQGLPRNAENAHHLFVEL